MQFVMWIGIGLLLICCLCRVASCTMVSFSLVVLVTYLLLWLPLPSPSLHQYLINLMITNYIYWRPFVVNPIVPPCFLTENDWTIDNINPNYEAWEVQDQTLLVWLQSTLSKLVLSYVLGATHSYEVWKKIHEYFELQN